MLNGSFHIEMWAIGKFASAATTLARSYFTSKTEKKEKTKKTTRAKERNIVKWVTFLAYFLHFLVVLFSHWKESNTYTTRSNGTGMEITQWTTKQVRNDRESERERKEKKIYICEVANFEKCSARPNNENETWTQNRFFFFFFLLRFSSSLALWLLRLYYFV